MHTQYNDGMLKFTMVCHFLLGGFRDEWVVFELSRVRTCLWD